ncbi:hypothetical protein FVEG_17586 [Fusarium verticillioides 7600]|uniref:Uncharacterized protein n=1 Tax=Gibberella moniliformis (strain M3125 / FGSC 7600) TaxID=334819 RepID=W7N6P4_GIBM7|nr:hypothetical protein FVEG_17586 [Fusarium verticillioides 7600]EWG55760.1 hypothetical protein FVEG_17586 [Fusarium verticillioides 7600]RBR19829.1 hypothetical protein FVER53590_25124 [Fusarium verticillioides]
MSWINLPEILTPQSKIIDISTTHANNDPTGPVTGGHMLIQGTMARVQAIDRKTDPVICREVRAQENYVSPVHFRGFDISGLQFGRYYALLIGICTDDPN